MEQTEELTQQVKRKVESVTSQAESVSNGASGISQVSEQQLAALAKANGMLADCTAATEKALAASRSCTISSLGCVLVITPCPCICACSGFLVSCEHICLDADHGLPCDGIQAKLNYHIGPLCFLSYHFRW